MNRFLVTILKYIVAYLAVNAFLKSLQAGITNTHPIKEARKEIKPNHFPANIPKGVIKGSLVSFQALPRTIGNGL